MNPTLVAAAKKYVRMVEAVNNTVGRITMYLIFLMMGVLLFTAISRSVFDTPLSWAMEMAQFTMAAYYLLGGGYTLLHGAHVRMDVFYDKWSPRKKAFTDSLTAFVLLFYLAVLFWGGFASASYSIEYGQRNHSAWAPFIAPIKIIMTFGMFLMLLQAIALLIKDIAAARGKELT